MSTDTPWPTILPGDCVFAVGDAVSKTGGDYRFDGIVVSVFRKTSGLIRLVVEDDRGILHIYSEANLRSREPKHEIDTGPE